ncbi:unnamed protein product [Trichobilharzia regenti]|nr:unnamed protein product [Trichobilharzia regenti]
MDTPPASSGTGETDTTVASTTKAITPGDQTTGPLGSGGSSSQGGQDNEQMDLASRRGRRSAIIDNKVRSLKVCILSLNLFNQRFSSYL